MSETVSGLVIQHGANRYLVEERATQDLTGGAGRVWACSVRGKLRKGRQAEVRLAVIGDWVEVVPSEPDADPPAGVVRTVLPRANKISRPAPSGRVRRTLEQVVVANLDRLWVVASLAQPPLNLRFVDRVLAAARFQDVPAGIVWNKTDLTDAADPEPLTELYGRLGVPVRVCSAVTGDGLDALTGDLRGAISAFVGLSGVGKSSLLGRIQPGLSIRVAEVGEKSGHGRHTTTTSRLYRLDCGGYVADTPGMREFGLWGMFKADLGAGFEEIEERASGCRFRDCLHVEEPGCAVREALDEGEIDNSRYLSYRALLEELPLDELERDGILKSPRRP